MIVCGAINMDLKTNQLLGQDERFCHDYIQGPGGKGLNEACAAALDWLEGDFER